MLKISVIIPMRNEERHINACLQSLLDQTLPADDYEVIVVDGQSEDGSAELIRALQLSFGNIVLLANPARIMPAAMNVGILHARSPIVMAAGAHTTYPMNYLEKCLSFLAKTDAAVVGGPIITLPGNGSFAARMSAAILSSRFGIGNSAFRTRSKEGFVESVPFGAYRKEILQSCGLYDEKLIRSQDYEIQARIRHMGGHIYQTPELTTYYRAVVSFGSLWKKAFATGLWQLFSIRQNPRSFALRHFVPALFVMGLVILASGALVIPAARVGLALALAAYVLAGICFGSSELYEPDLITRFAIPLFTFPFHFSYGAGIIAGAWYLCRDPGVRKSSGKAGQATVLFSKLN
jgi:glycosyltransferase involved in cell wall biosynthesis